MVLPTIISSSPLDGTSLAPSSGSGHVDTRCLLNMWPMRHTYRVPTGPIFWTKLQRSEEALWIICPALFISCYFHKPAFPSTAKLPIWGGGAQHESCYGVPGSPRATRRPQRPALLGVSRPVSRPCGIGAAAHQPAPWHQARDASQPAEEAAWQAASSQCLSWQPGGRPGRAEPLVVERAKFLLCTRVQEGREEASPQQGPGMGSCWVKSQAPSPQSFSSVLHKSGGLQAQHLEREEHLKSNK